MILGKNFAMLLRIIVKIIIFIMFVLGGMLPSFSEVDIVYPKKSGANSYAKSAFILGNIGEDFFFSSVSAPLRVIFTAF